VTIYKEKGALALVNAASSAIESVAKTAPAPASAPLPAAAASVAK
jgi:hypothetical protein